MEYGEDRTEEQLRWRIEIIRRHDPNHMITAHGVARSWQRIKDEWRCGRNVEIFGYTFSNRYNRIMAGDQIRKGAALNALQIAERL